MGVFKRVSDIISANIHHLLDRCEDPEKMCKQVVRELEAHLTRVRHAVVQAVAAERQLRASLDQNRDVSFQWAERAAQALGEGEEELARRALRQKLSYQSAADRLQPDWERAAAGAEELRSQLVILQQKLREACHYRDMLIARQRAAEAKRQVERSLVRLSQVGEKFQQLGRMAEVVSRLELEVAAEAELRSEEQVLVAELDSRQESQEVEAELEALRQRLSAPQVSTKTDAPSSSPD